MDPRAVAPKRKRPKRIAKKIAKRAGYLHCEHRIARYFTARITDFLRSISEAKPVPWNNRPFCSPERFKVAYESAMRKSGVPWEQWDEERGTWTPWPGEGK